MDSGGRRTVLRLAVDSLPGVGVYLAGPVSAREEMGCSVCAGHGGLVHSGRMLRLLCRLPLRYGISVRAWQRRGRAPADYDRELLRQVRRRNARDRTGV